MYFVQLTIPKNTSRLVPQLTVMDFAPGILRQIRILHPAGCADLVGVCINYLGARLLPMNDQAWFLGNGFPIEFAPNFDVRHEPTRFDIYSYNEDDTYQHRPTIMFEIEFTGSLAEREKNWINAAQIPVLLARE